MSRFDEIKARHIQHEAILAQMRIDYADKNHKPIELLTNQTHKDRKELLDMVAKLEARLADRHQRMEDRMHERDTERHETDLRILALEAQVKENQKELLIFAASAAKAQQGLYEDEEFPFTKAELRTKLSFAANYISGLATALRHTALKGEG